MHYQGPPIPAALPAGTVPPVSPRAAQASGTDRHAPPTGRALAVLSLGALGIVFGDIGTSPLYALKECFTGPHGVAPTPLNVLGVLSLVFWAMTFVVTFKYLTFVMRADNRGEGGILALMALVASARRRSAAAGRSSCWGSSGRRSSTATASSPPPSACSRRWRAWRWRRQGSDTSSSR